MKKYALALLLAALVVLTGITLRHSVAGTSPSNVQDQKLVAIGTEPVPLPPQLTIGTEPVPLPPSPSIGTEPVPLPPKASIGTEPVPLPPGSHKRAL